MDWRQFCWKGMAICRNWRSPYRRPISKVWGLRPIRPCRPPLSLRPGPGRALKSLKLRDRSWTKTLKQVPGRNLIKPSMEKWNWASEFKMKSNEEKLFFSFSRQKLKKVFLKQEATQFLKLSSLVSFTSLSSSSTSSLPSSSTTRQRNQVWWQNGFSSGAIFKMTSYQKWNVWRLQNLAAF